MKGGVTEAIGSDPFVRGVLDALAERVAVLDEQGRILLVNDAWRAVAERSSGGLDAAVEGSDYLAFCDRAAVSGDGDAARFAGGARDVLAGRISSFDLEPSPAPKGGDESFAGRVTRFTHDGKARLVLVHGNARGSPTAAEHDRLPEPQASADANADAELYRTLVEQLPAMTYVDVASSENPGAATEPFYVSPQIRDILGCDPERWLADLGYWRKHLHPEDEPRVWPEWKRCSSAGEPFEAEYRMMRPDGGVVWIHERTSVTLDDGGKLRLVRGVLLDVTDRKRAEEAVVRSEGLLAEAQRLARVGSYELDLAEDRMTWSSELFRIYGLDPVATAPSLDLIFSLAHQEDDTALREQLQRMLEEGGRSEIVHRIVRPDGEERVLHGLARVDLDDSGHPMRLTGTAQDITDNVRVEQQLRAAHEALRAIYDSAPVAIVAMDGEGVVKMWSPGAERLLGWTAEEAVGSLLPTIREADLPGFRESLARAMEGEAFETQRRRHTEKGEPIDLRIATAPLRGTSGAIEGVMSIMIDITAGKRMEEQLREAEARYRTLIEQIPAGTYIWEIEPDPANPRYYVSPQLEAMLGFTPEVWNADVDFWEKRLHPDDRDLVLSATARSMETGEPFRVECRYIHRDGRVVWIRDEAVLLSRRADGRPDLFQGVMFDISERVQAEQALRESLQRFQNLARQAPVGIFQADARGDIVYVNDRWCEISGLTPEAAAARGWGTAVYPDDRQVIADWYEHSGKLSEFRTEMRFLRPDGEVRSVAATATPLLDATGRLTGYLGTVIDLTERVRAEQRLRLLESAVEDTAEAIAVIARSAPEAPSSIVYANRAFGAMTGWEHADAIGSALDEMVSERTDPEAAAAFVRALAEGRAFRGELWSRRSDGSEFMVDLHVSPIFDADGSVANSVAIARDVTAARAAEQALQDSVQILSTADAERRSLLKYLVEAEELERGRLAEGIQDDSIQQMTAVGLRLGALRRSLSDPNQLGALDQLGESVERAVDRLRTLLVELRPRSLDLDGLGAALRQYLQRVAGGTGLVFGVEDRMTGDPGPESRAAAFRVAQDHVTSVVQRGLASRLEVVLEERRGGFVVRIEDDGSPDGTDPESQAAAFELAALRERAELIGGAVELRSRSGEGTTLEVWLPL